MTAPFFAPPHEDHPGIAGFTGWVPLPEIGFLPVRAFHIDDAEPMLIDTGLPPFADDFMRALGEVGDPAALRWIFMTHLDPDHMGAFDRVLEAAPNATVITGGIGAAKLGLLGKPTDRLRLVAPGDTLSLGRRTFHVVRPPWFDAPETLGLVEPAEGVFFCADAFATLLDAPCDAAEAIEAEALLAGMARWVEIDAPHLADADPARFAFRVEQVRALAPRLLLSSHLAPSRDATGRLIETAIAVQRAARTPLAAAA